MNLIPYASEVYNTRGNDQVAAGFRATYSHECKPHFIGVWDTVGSLGWWFGKKFFNTQLNPDVTNAYQAISIDEKRKKFPISLWDEDNLAPHQNLVQVWFAGVHSTWEVGTSSVVCPTSLIWMLENAEKHGLRLKPGWQADLKPDPLGQIHESREGFWRLWRPAIRQIPQGAKIHSSVRTRMEGTKDYSPPLPAKYTFVDLRERASRASG